MFLVVSLVTTPAGFIKKFHQIHFLFDNTQVELNIDATEEWKYQGLRGMPLNEYSKKVHISKLLGLKQAFAF